jgi:hypothetical protein
MRSSSAEKPRHVDGTNNGDHGFLYSGGTNGTYTTLDPRNFALLDGETENSRIL